MRNIFFIILAAGSFLSGCDITRGTLDLQVKVYDEFTREPLAGRRFIIEALTEADGKIIPVEIGQFSTDSSGRFNYTLEKIRDVYDYNFCMVGDSDYVSLNRKLNIYQIKLFAADLSFFLSRLADLTIVIDRVSTSPAFDTLSLYWESDGRSCWSLYPYEINNLVKTDDRISLTSGRELRWIGGSVHSVVRTRVFADKRTELYWGLDRHGRRKEFIDEVICKRDISNIVHFKY